MPVFSSKMTLFGKAGLYTIIGMVSVLALWKQQKGLCCQRLRNFGSSWFLVKH